MSPRMLPRKNLAPNNQKLTPKEYSPTLGPQWPKSTEIPSIVSWASPGRGQAGESVSGGPNTKRWAIRKGPMR